MIRSQTFNVKKRTYEIAEELGDYRDYKCLGPTSNPNSDLSDLIATAVLTPTPHTGCWQISIEKKQGGHQNPRIDVNIHQDVQKNTPSQDDINSSYFQ